MESEDCVEEDVCNIYCSGCSLGRLEVNHFRESVYKYNDRIVSILGWRKFNNEVHCYLFPLLAWGGKWLQEACWELGG